MQRREFLNAATFVGSAVLTAARAKASAIRSLPLVEAGAEVYEALRLQDQSRQDIGSQRIDGKHMRKPIHSPWMRSGARSLPTSRSFTEEHNDRRVLSSEQAAHSA